ncbi:MAG: hypothetical protein ACPG3W_05850 [Synechococcus sp.]
MAPSASEQQRPKRPRFWVGPLVAGACFALGYGITQRVVLMRAAWQQPQQEAFRQQGFPGETLEALRRRYGEDKALMGDVAALEAVEAEQRKLEQAKEQAAAIAAEAERRQAEQQAALVEPVWTEPAWTATPVAAPAVELPAAELEPETPAETAIAPLPDPVIDAQDPDLFESPAPPVNPQPFEDPQAFSTPPTAPPNP